MSNPDAGLLFGKNEKNEEKEKMREDRIQADIVKYLQTEKIYCHSVPNEAAGSNAVRAMQMVSMGMRSGVGDLVMFWPTVADYRDYPVDIQSDEPTYPAEIGYMEVKRPGDGKQSKAQVKFEKRCKRHGIPYLVVFSVDEVSAELTRRKLLV